MPKATRSSVRKAVHSPTSAFATFAESLNGGISSAAVRKRQQTEVRFAMAELGEVVYGILTTDGLIKFGYSTNLRSRLQSYGIGVKNAKRLLMVKPGTMIDEQIIHGRFASHVARGREYFHPAREILDFINTERALMGVPPLPI